MLSEWRLMLTGKAEPSCAMACRWGTSSRTICAQQGGRSQWRVK